MAQDNLIPRVPFHHKRDDPLACEIARLEQLHPSAWDKSPHRHTFYMIIWVTAGQGFHMIDFAAYPLAPDTVFLLTPDQIQHWDVAAAPDGWAVLFTHDFLLHTLQQPTLLYELNLFYEVSRTPTMALAPGQAAALGRTLESLHAEYAGRDSGREGVIRAYLHILLIQIHRCYAAAPGGRGGSPQASLVRRYIQLVDQHFATLQHVENYAGQLAISAGHLNDLAREATGLTASGIIRRRLTLEAKRVLAHTDWPIVRIALELGFSDPAYFGRFFRREVGATPGQFRQSFREKYHASLGLSLVGTPSVG